MNIRPVSEKDYDTIWRIFQATVEAGDVFAVDAGMSRDESLALWCGADKHTYAAEQDGVISGSYYLKANQHGPGDHVANAAYMVDPAARGQGIGQAMGEHSLVEAKRLGFRAMQFNFVVATNHSALRLWKKLGFHIVGTLPGAFRHPEQGFVDAYVMFRSL